MKKIFDYLNKIDYNHFLQKIFNTSISKTVTIILTRSFPHCIDVPIPYAHASNLSY